MHFDNHLDLLSHATSKWRNSLKLNKSLQTPFHLPVILLSIYQLLKLLPMFPELRNNAVRSLVQEIFP